MNTDGRAAGTSNSLEGKLTDNKNIDPCTCVNHKIDEKVTVTALPPHLVAELKNEIRKTYQEKCLNQMDCWKSSGFTAPEEEYLYEFTTLVEKEARNLWRMDKRCHPFSIREIERLFRDAFNDILTKKRKLYELSLMVHGKKLLLEGVRRFIQVEEELEKSWIIKDIATYLKKLPKKYMMEITNNPRWLEYWNSIVIEHSLQMNRAVELIELMDTNFVLAFCECIEDPNKIIPPAVTCENIRNVLKFNRISDRVVKLLLLKYHTYRGMYDFVTKYVVVENRRTEFLAYAYGSRMWII